MIPIVLGAVVLLVALGILLSREAAARPAFIAAVTSIALIPFSLSLGVAVLRFLRRFRELAATGGGGLAALQPPCLEIVRSGLLGTAACAAVLLAALVAMAPALGGTREGATGAGAQEISSGRAVALATLSLFGPVCARVTLGCATKAAVRTMLLVDPGVLADPVRKAQADALFQGMTLAEVSTQLTSLTLIALWGSIASVPLLAGAAVAGVLVPGAARPSLSLKVYALGLILVLLALAAWDLTTLSSLAASMTPAARAGAGAP